MNSDVRGAPETPDAALRSALFKSAGDEGEHTICRVEGGAPLHIEIPDGGELALWRERAAHLSAEATRLKLINPPQIVYDEASSRARLELLPTDRCGFVSGPDLLWSVQPKIKGTRWLDLVALKHGLPPSEHRAHLSTSSASSLWQLLAWAYAEALTDAGCLRRGYDARAETLRGRVRGRIEVSRYLLHKARLEPLSVPCRFTSMDLDNPINQTLAWALRLLQRGAPQGEQGPVELTRRLRQLEAKFAGVSTQRVSMEAARAWAPAPPARVRLPAGFDRFRPALALARFIIEHLQLDERHGRATTFGFAFQMWALYEEAFAAGIQAEAARSGLRAVTQQTWPVQFGDVGRTTIRPDVFLPSTSTSKLGATLPLVLDTKWKFGLSPEVENIDAEVNNTIKLKDARVRTSDVYQIYTYARRARAEAKSSGAVGVLVYPFVATGAAFSEPIPIEITHAGDPVRVYCLGWNVGVRCNARFPTVARRLFELAQAQPR